MKTETLKQDKLLRALKFSGMEAIATPPRDGQSLTLIIQGVIERFEIREGLSVTMGRFDSSSRGTADLDLTPYNGVRKGVSRRHARLYFEGNVLYVTDLG